MLKLKKFLKIFNIMPEKKKENDILYVSKNVVDQSPHPIIVGCGELFIPVKILSKSGESYMSPCHIRIETSLNNKTNGVNLNKISDYFLSKTPLTIDELFDDVQHRFTKEFETQNLKLKVDFSYFCTKKTPVSDKKCLYKYNSSITLCLEGNKKTYFLETNLPYSSLCPASKEISDYGAHNQRGNAFFRVEFDDINIKKSFWIDDLIFLLDKSCSSPVYNMTNLQDEAYQTELMYENALFIEEIAKNVSEKLQKHVNERQIKHYLVELSQKESINTYETLVKIEYGEK